MFGQIERESILLPLPEKEDISVSFEDFLEKNGINPDDAYKVADSLKSCLNIARQNLGLSADDKEQDVRMYVRGSAVAVICENGNNLTLSCEVKSLFPQANINLILSALGIPENFYYFFHLSLDSKHNVDIRLEAIKQKAFSSDIIEVSLKNDLPQEWRVENHDNRFLSAFFSTKNGQQVNIGYIENYSRSYQGGCIEKQHFPLLAYGNRNNLRYQTTIRQMAAHAQIQYLQETNSFAFRLPAKNLKAFGEPDRFCQEFYERQPDRQLVEMARALRFNGLNPVPNQVSIEPSELEKADRVFCDIKLNKIYLFPKVETIPEITNNLLPTLLLNPEFLLFSLAHLPNFLKFFPSLCADASKKFQNSDLVARLSCIIKERDIDRFLATIDEEQITNSALNRQVEEMINGIRNPESVWTQIQANLETNHSPWKISSLDSYLKMLLLFKLNLERFSV